MKKQFFSNEYEDDKELAKLVEAIDRKCESLNGIIFYRFPTLKEFDKSAVQPDLLIISEKYGVLVVVADYMFSVRDKEWESFLEKKEYVDSQIYTCLLKNKLLKNNSRSLKFVVNTIGFCPNMTEQRSNDNVFCSISSILEFLDGIDDNKLDEIISREIIASLESSAAIIKPKERILPEGHPNTKAEVLKEIEARIARFDDEQRLSALSLLDGPQRIRGLAGSGKTIILCLKAAHLHMINPDKVILYTFYTRSLYDYIVQLITRFYMKMTDGQLPDFDKIRILHAWGGRQVKGVYYEACKANGVVPLTFDDTRGIKNRFEYICSKFIKETKNSPRKLFDYVLMDEAQDFPVSFYQLCRAIVKNDQLVWCYDEVQNIFDVEIQNTQKTFSNDFDPKGIDLVSESAKHPYVKNDIVLHKSYRNVRKILLVAVALGFGIYNDKLVQSLENNNHWQDLGFNVLSGDCSKEEDVIIERDTEESPLDVDETRSGSFVRTFTAKDINAEMDIISNEIEKAIKDDRLLPEDIAVICLNDLNSATYMQGLESRLFDKKIDTFNVLDKNYIKGFYREGKVTLSSVYKAKGNEAAMVFVCGCDSFERHKDERRARNAIFTAFTRAKVWLNISGVGPLKQILSEMEALKENNYRLCFYNKPTHILDLDWSERASEISDVERINIEIIEASKKLNISPEEYLEQLRKIHSRKEENSDE